MFTDYATMKCSCMTFSFRDWRLVQFGIMQDQLWLLSSYSINQLVYFQVFHSSTKKMFLLYADMSDWCLIRVYMSCVCPLEWDYRYSTVQIWQFWFLLLNSMLRDFLGQNQNGWRTNSSFKIVHHCWCWYWEILTFVHEKRWDSPCSFNI